MGADSNDNNPPLGKESLEGVLRGDNQWCHAVVNRSGHGVRLLDGWLEWWAGSRAEADETRERFQQLRGVLRQPLI